MPNATPKPKPFLPLLDYQKQAVESNARFRWSCWSRQTGKSFTYSLRRILRGLKRGRNQIFLSASERQSRELMQKARQHCQALQIAIRHYNCDYLDGTSYKQLEIGLPNGVRIIGLPAKPDTIRGFTGDVFLDEFAMHADDRAIWAAIFPTLLRGDGELDIASTPKGKKNMFYELSKNDRFECTTVTLPNAVQQGRHVDADEVRRSMGDEELYRQEFLCEFLDETTAFLTYDQISACEDPTLEKNPHIDTLAQLRGNLYVGIDIGRTRDLTVVWIIERQDETLTTRAIYEHRGLPFRDQYNLFSEVLSLRNVRRCCIDAGGIGMQLAESAVEDFGAHRVEAVTFTNAIKSELATRLRIAVEEQRIRIPVDQTLRNDWHSLGRSITASGHTRFDASRSATGHADRFWAAALAIHAAGNPVGKPHCLNVKPLAFATTGAW
ncbi:MAG: hypothetical protein IID39_08440 [Planctomycetes bacterium]|nr:hypothetical protein [Planctomycetota bacterium]